MTLLFDGKGYVLYYHVKFTDETINNLFILYCEKNLPHIIHHKNTNFPKYLVKILPIKNKRSVENAM